MTPSVPSEPMKIWFRSGPAACFGAGEVSMIVPFGRTTSICRTMSSILPYLVEETPIPRCARKPPTVEQVSEDG